MSKKVNFGTINAETMEKLSGFSVAREVLKDLRASYNADMDVLKDELAAIKDKRQKAISDGMTADEAISAFSIENINARINARTEKFKAACEPHNKAKKEACSMVPDSIYHAYALSMEKGDCGATGKLIIKKGKKEEEYTVEKSFKMYIVDFLEEIGCKSDNATAIRKFADVMKTWTGGMIKSENEDYLKLKSATQFKELFVRAFLQYTINKKGIITKNEDNTLSMTVYED